MTRAGASPSPGVVVNVRRTSRGAEYDRLKAILTRRARRPAGKNRAGAPPTSAPTCSAGIPMAVPLNPARGAKLQARFARIDWAGPSAG